MKEQQGSASRHLSKGAANAQISSGPIYLGRGQEQSGLRSPQIGTKKFDLLSIPLSLRSQFKSEHEDPLPYKKRE